jgi:hypothetical protein
MRLNEIRAESPFPWKTLVNPLNGNVQMVDAAGKVVPLFTITGLCELVTASNSHKPTESQETKCEAE